MTTPGTYDNQYGPTETNEYGYLIPASKATLSPKSGGTAPTSARSVDLQSQAKADGSLWFQPVFGDHHYNPGAYGYRKPPEKGGHMHWAIDIYGKVGQPVVAPVTGTITSAGYGDIAGYYVKMRGTDGIDYYFAHLNEKPPVAKGQKVQAGRAIGGVGATGNAKGTPPHVHFSMKKNGKHINPHSFMQSGQQQSLSKILELGGNPASEAEKWARQAELLAPYAQSQATGTSPEGWMLGQQPDQTGSAAPGARGQQMLGMMMDGFSRQLAGGSRTPIPRAPGGQAVDNSLDNPTQQERRFTPQPELEDEGT